MPKQIIIEHYPYKAVLLGNAYFIYEYNDFELPKYVVYTNKVNEMNKYGIVTHCLYKSDSEIGQLFNQCQAELNKTTMTEQEKEFKELQEHIQYYKDKYGTVGNLSDGYHSFNDLYDHRCRLFISLCRLYSELKYESINLADIYKVRKLEGEKWFLLVLIDKIAKTNKQISYHLPEKYYEECGYFSDLIEKKDWKKMYDGHTSEDVLKRLKDL